MNAVARIFNTNTALSSFVTFSVPYSSTRSSHSRKSHTIPRTPSLLHPFRNSALPMPLPYLPLTSQWAHQPLCPPTALEELNWQQQAYQEQQRQEQQRQEQQQLSFQRRAQTTS